MNKDIPYVESLPSHWSVIQNRFLFRYDGKKVGEDFSKYQLLSLTTSGVKERDINASGGKVPASYDNYQTVRKGQMVFCLFDLDCSAVFSGISNYDGMITSAYDVFSSTGRMDNAFANYWFKFVFSNRYYKMFSKSIRYTITGDMFRSLKTPVPPHDEQKKISAYLFEKEHKIDDLISNVQAQIDKLKEYKQSIITEVVTKGLDPTVPMKDSGIRWLGQIPEPWDIVKIIRIADKTHPYAIGDGDHGLIKPDNYQDQGIPYIRVQNLGWASELDTTNIVYISDETNERIKNSTLRPNDVLFAKTGATIGKTAIVPSSIPIANTTSHVGKITVSPKYDPRYIFYVLSSAMGYRQFWEYASSKTTRPELAIDEIKQVYITLPRSKEEQAEIVAFLDKKCLVADELIQLKQKKVDKLNEYKKSLIYEYVTGKKEVVQ